MYDDISGIKYGSTFVDGCQSIMRPYLYIGHGTLPHRIFTFYRYVFMIYKSGKAQILHIMARPRTLCPLVIFPLTYHIS